MRYQALDETIGVRPGFFEIQHYCKAILNKENNIKE